MMRRVLVNHAVIPGGQRNPVQRMLLDGPEPSRFFVKALLHLRKPDSQPLAFAYPVPQSVCFGGIPRAETGPPGDIVKPSSGTQRSAELFTRMRCPLRQRF